MDDSLSLLSGKILFNRLDLLLDFLEDWEERSRLNDMNPLYDLEDCIDVDNGESVPMDPLRLVMLSCASPLSQVLLCARSRLVWVVSSVLSIEICCVSGVYRDEFLVVLGEVDDVEPPELCLGWHEVSTVAVFKYCLWSSSMYLALNCGLSGNG